MARNSKRNFAVRLLGAFLCAFAPLVLPVAASAQETYVPESQQRELYEISQQSELPEVEGTTNLFANVIGFAYPKEWVPVYRVQRPGMFMLEYIPFGEDVRTNWTQMLTIQAFSSPQTRTAQPSQFAEGWGQLMSRNCNGEGSFDDLGAIAIDGAVSRRVAFECITAENSELTVNQITRSRGEIIIVQLVTRGRMTGSSLSERREYFTNLLDRLTFADNSANQAI